MSTGHASSSGPKGTAVIRFDPAHVTTIPGLLKAAEAIVSLIGFICIQTVYLASYFSAGGWFSFVSMSGFWISLILLILYVFHIVEKLSWLPWTLTETAYAVIWSAFFFIAGCVAASNGRSDPGWGAAAFFGFLAMIIFGYEAFNKYKAWKQGDAPQSETSTTHADTSTPTGPSYPTY